MAFRPAFSVVIPLLLAVACGGTAQDSDPNGDGDGDGDSNGDGDGDGASASLEEALESRTFVLVSAEGYTPVSDTTVSISFEDGVLGFSAGCNGHAAEFDFDEDVLVADNFGSTDIACASELHDQDAWLAEFLSERPTATLDGAQLTLQTETATLVLVDEDGSTVPAPLVGTVWEVRALTERNSASGGFDVAPTVTFAPDGTVEVFTGCNTGSGGYEITGDTISFPQGIGYSEADCPDSSLSLVEEHIQAVFTDGEVTYSLDDESLTIERGDIGVTARKAE
jgi:heat shock protein HslJ